ncbi:peptidase, putative, (fragment), partial [Trypanosoma vivax Y486]
MCTCVCLCACVCLCVFVHCIGAVVCFCVASVARAPCGAWPRAYALLHRPAHLPFTLRARLPLGQQRQTTISRRTVLRHTRMSQPSSGCFCCGGTSGSLNLAGLAEQLALNASPYNVPSVGTVARPHGVDVDALMRDAASIRGTKPWNAPGRPSGEVRGLFIGINYYGTSAQLSGCCNDVKQVLGTLQKCGMPITSANILVDEDGFPGRSGQPTRHNILRHLAWLVLGAKPGDVLFLFFSGHGTQTKALHDAAEEFDQCLLPVDYEKNGCILDNDIHKVLLSRLPAGVRLTAVFDCCHSGTMMDLAFKYACSASSAPQCGGHMERIREGNDVKADVLMVSGCEDDQTSADVH